MQLKEAERIMCMRYSTLVARFDGLRQQCLLIASLIKRTLINVHLQRSSDKGGWQEHGPIASGARNRKLNHIYGQLSIWIYGLRLFFFKNYRNLEVWPWTALQAKPMRMTFIV